MYHFVYAVVLLFVAQVNAQEVLIKSTPLSSSLFMLEGDGGNMTALIGPEGTLLVDDDFAAMADKLVKKLKELGGNSPKFIINTHFHYDHTGGNEVFGPSATIIAATAVRERLLHEQTLWKKQHPPAPPQALPDLTFEKTLTFFMNKERIRIVHLKSGHTDGDTVVFFENGKVASLGDLYFSGMYPIFHLEHQGSLEGFAANILDVLEQLPEDAKVVPGHGPLTGKPELKEYYRMIQASMETVRNAIKKGHGLAQIQKAGLPPKWEVYSHGYVSTDRWLEMIYRALKK